MMLLKRLSISFLIFKRHNSNLAVSVLTVATNCNQLLPVSKMSSPPVSIKYNWGITPSNPEQKPVLIVGQVPHLATLSWDDVKCKLQPLVTEEVWRRGLDLVSASPGDTVELSPGGASLASLPSRRARHAAPSRCHSLAKIVRGVTRPGDEAIVLVCRKMDVYALAVALSRSYPKFCTRTTRSPLGTTAPAPASKHLQVDVLLVDGRAADGDISEEGFGEVDPYLLEATLSAADIQIASLAGEAAREAARITDAPTNYMNCDTFIEEARKVAKDLNIPEPTVIRGEDLKTRGFGGIYGVGKAAAIPPALVCLSYTTGDACATVAWVGKGIVYDTGGLSIKSRLSMVSMKTDCGGAAAVLAGFASFVKCKPTVNIHAVLCLAENSVGPDATRPDDIHTMYSGRTVEINNTDAEGRLVLSDGVVYAQKDLKADVIVDVATLTGAQGVATGKYHAGILSNKSKLESLCITAGLRSGELTHPLPFAPELHFREFASPIADMKNSVADRNNAQPSCAGLFVLSHLGFEWAGSWLHVDMAGPAHCGERATGYGAALLNVLFGHHTRNKYLKALSPGPVV